MRPFFRGPGPGIWLRLRSPRYPLPGMARTKRHRTVDYFKGAGKQGNPATPQLPPVTQVMLPSGSVDLLDPPLLDQRSPRVVGFFAAEGAQTD